jgi:hypothetical protein
MQVLDPGSDVGETYSWILSFFFLEMDKVIGSPGMYPNQTLKPLKSQTRSGVARVSFPACRISRGVRHVGHLDG